jgi:integrase
MTNTRTSFFMWSPPRDCNYLRSKRNICPRQLRKYTLRCISTNVEITAENPLHSIAKLTLANTMDYVASGNRRTAWRKLTRAAGLQGFRVHDCRHHAITELAKSQARDATIMALAGHL